MYRPRRALLASVSLALIAFSGLPAFGDLPPQPITYSPEHPRSGDVVTFTILTGHCAYLLDTAVVAVPSEAGNGSIRFTVTQPYDCITTPPPSIFHEDVRLLAPGRYDLTLLLQTCDFDEANCTPPQAAFSSTLEVSDTTLALRQGRFRISAEWSAPGFGQGVAHGVPLTDESGYFTFFSPTNLELVAKAIDGCSVNQRYWIFLGGLTDVEVTVRVEDTGTGAVKTYVNPSGRTFEAVLDTSSFATCP